MPQWRLWTKLRRHKPYCRLFTALVLLVVIFFFFSCLLALLVRVPRWKPTFPVGRPESSIYITKFPVQNGARGNPPRHGHRINVTDLGTDEEYEEDEPENSKTILLWTEYFESDTWATNENTFKSCPVKSCSTTTDRGRLQEAHALMMNVRDFSSPAELPAVHPPWQVWILHGSEPPYYIWQDLSRYQNVFNWTSWYRSDADIFSPYGTFIKRPTKALEADVPDIISLHDKLVYWMASNCFDLGRRYTRVAALQKYIQVDTYGSCGDMVCRKGSQDCDGLLRRYKFVLAFENGYCRDYITEKLWNAYRKHQIPIVSGGADYSKLAIPGSYIDYDNFSSVEELAEFIEKVGSDRDLYNSFFKWRTKYRLLSIGEQGIANWCQICEALHDEERQPQVYRDIQGWVAEDSCPLYWGVQQFITADIYRFMFKVFGV